MLKKALILLLSLSLLIAVPGISRAVSMTSPPMGMIALFPYDFTPRGWELCNGNTLNIASNAALFLLLGASFGGDGSNTFALPKLNATGTLQELHANPAERVRYYINTSASYGVNSSHPMLGEIVLFPKSAAAFYTNFSNIFLPCDGRNMTIADNSALCSLFGTTFGGNGSTTFALPDLRHSVPVTEADKNSSETLLMYYMAVQGFYPSTNVDNGFVGGIGLYPYQVGTQQYLTSLYSCTGNAAIYTIFNNQILFSLLGTAFGGNGITTFGVPDLTGAVPAPQLYYGMTVNGIYPARD